MVIQKSFLFLLFVIPLLFSPISSELFEFPKILLLYGLTIIIFSLHLINVFSKRSTLFRPTSLNFPLVLFLISQLIATYYSVDHHTSIFGYYSRFNGGLLSTLCYLILYFTISNYIDDKFRQNIIKTSLLSALLVASFGIAQHFGIDKNYWVQDVQSRVFSTLGQPNWLAAYLGILLPFSIYGFITAKTLFSRFSYQSLNLIFFLCLIFTKSKTGLIAALLSISIFLLLYFLKEKTKPSFLLSFGTLIIFLLMAIFINNPIKDKIFPPQVAISAVPNSTINITPSEDIRKLVWQGAFDLWKKFPFFGTGVETYAYSYYWTRPTAHNLTSEWDFLYNKAHNEYLNYLATTGTFGTLSYLLLIIIIIYQLIKKNSLQDFAILSAFISILITNTTGFSVVVTSLYFYLLPALSLPSPPSNQNKHSNKLAAVLISIVSLYLLTRVIAYYLADLEYNTAESYQNQSYYSLALQKIQDSTDFFPGEPTYIMKKSNILVKNALIAHQEKNPTEAKRLAQLAIDAGNKAISISPANVNFYKELSQNYYYLSTIDSQYYQEAIKNIIKATRLAPTDAKSFYILGKFWATISRNDEAIKSYQQAINLKSNYDYATYDLGLLYFSIKDYPQAKKYFQDTLVIAPNNTQAQSYLEKINLLIGKSP